MTQCLDMKCKLCRYTLLKYPETRVESSHGALADDTCATHCHTDVWYIPEQHMPSWMTSDVEKGKWVKGKVNCPKCQGRLGSYNFVSGMKCPCGLEVVAPIHIVKSKVDFFFLPVPSTCDGDDDTSTFSNVNQTQADANKELEISHGERKTETSQQEPDL